MLSPMKISCASAVHHYLVRDAVFVVLRIEGFDKQSGVRVRGDDLTDGLTEVLLRWMAAAILRKQIIAVEHRHLLFG